ncbi:MAG: hypothetical protein ACOX5G_03380 [Kiritimatiellia bacterium]|jgi:predicted GH43/DUF377 family glycosyl hydrolase
MTSAGWQKSESNPVLGGSLGTCFDVCVLEEGGLFKMWFSWRPRKSIALSESRDGVRWSEPRIALEPDSRSGWRDDVNRPCVLKDDTGYHMWFTGQTRDRSYIGYAFSPDGLTWKPVVEEPVLSPELPWEKAAVMCPHVLWDEREKQYRMWYSGGEQYEPDAIGYATSPDGIRWTQWPANPIFTGDPACGWEKYKVTACQVIQQDDRHIMFYIGFRDVHHARIGLARSRDGIHDWERHPDNPVISPGRDGWDADACYKPYAIYDREQSLWRLWYNGRRGHSEQIGLAMHAGEALWPT